MNKMKILAFEESCAVLVEDYEVYAWGEILGLLNKKNDNKNFTPLKLSSLLPKFKELNVDYIYSNDIRLFMKNKDFQVFVKGFGQNAELGLGKKKYEVESIESIAYKLPQKEEFISIKNGPKFTILLTNLGNIYTFGDNEYGCLGNGKITKYYQDGEYVTEIQGKDYNHHQPTKISLPKLKPNEFFNQILVDYDSVFAITNLNEVYYWGYQVVLERGKYKLASIATPTPMPLDELAKGEYFISINSNQGNFNLLLTNFGNLYYFGDPNNSILSLKKLLIIKKVKALIHQINLKSTPLEKEKIIKITSGEFHFLLLTETGKVFTLGASSKGGRGYSEFRIEHISNAFNKRIPMIELISAISFPTLVSGETIIDIASGNYHNMVITNKNRIFTWGNNKEGQVGNGKFTDYGYGFSDTVPGIDNNQPTPFEVFLK
jgi:alpha-tubulin suppressor-like RCC1 family protein